MALALDRDGAAVIAGAAVSVLPALVALADALPSGRAGLRLHRLPALDHLLAPAGPITASVEAALASPARPVRAILSTPRRTCL